jgi:iron complex outermembrane receptor protein
MCNCRFALALVCLCFTVRTLAASPDVNDVSGLFDLSIEALMDIRVDTVYGASKRQQKVTEAPSSVTIVTDEQIEQFGYRTLADVLAGTRAFYTTYDRNYRYVGVRGFGRPADYNNRVLLLIDGHRLNENIGGGSPVGTDLALDLDLVDRVEIIRGPGSSLYGTNALFGVINIITKRPQDYNTLEVEGQVVTSEQTRGRVTYGKALENGPDILVSATGFHDDGRSLYFPEFDDPATNFGRVDNDGQGHYNMFAKTSLGKYTLTAAHGTVGKDVPTAPWWTVFGDTRTRTRDAYTLLGLDYKNEISENFAVSARASYNHYDYDGWWVYDYAEEPDPPYLVVNRDYWRGRWWIGELTFTARPWAKHQLTWGTEFQYNARQEQKNWDEEVYFFDRRHSRNWAFFIQDEYTLREDLHLHAGVRFDEYVGLGHTTNPRLALTYALSDATVLKAIYGTAFRAPTVYELYYHDGEYSAKPSPNLTPEKMETTELVLEHRFSDVTRLALAGFYYEVKDVIDQFLDPADDLLTFRNGGHVTAKGAEIELSHRWQRGITLTGSYSFVQAKNSETQERLPNSPEHLAKVRLLVPLIDRKLFAGLETCYTGSARTLAGNRAGGFGLTNLTFTYRDVVEGLDAGFSLYNLLDKDYGYPGGSEHTQDVIAQDGIQAAFQLTYRF